MNRKYTPRGSAALSLLLAALQVIAPVASVAGNITPANGRTTVSAAANGVPVVNIARPGARGVSHNRFNAFDVGRNGVLLNNSGAAVRTKLGGWIEGNPRLGDSRARLILNEVTGANASSLRGYLEVAGDRADVVVANENGITCNGCGFINTGKLVLTTGAPLWNDDETLRGYRISGGSVEVSGDGLDASRADALDIYARALRLNAAMQAQTIDLVLGVNDVSAGGRILASGSGAAAPLYAIDAGELGGMYANRIRLVGTEQGVGMRIAGELVAFDGRLALSAAGDLHIESSASVVAGKDAALQATAINNAGTLAANGGMALTTDALANSGTLVAGGDIALQAMALQNAGTIDAAGNLSLGELDVLANAGGTLRAGNNLSLALAAFDDRLVGGLLESWGTTTITAGQASFHERLMTPGSLLLQVGQLDIGADATVAAWGGTVVETDTLDNRGVLFGHAGLGINAASSVANRENAVLLADGDLWIAGEGEQALPELVNRGGRIESTAGDVWLAAASIRNTNVGWDTRTSHWTEVDYQHGQTAFDTFYFSGEEWSENIHTWRRTTHGTDRDVVAQGVRGLILAAGNITLAGGDITNNRSLVSAGGDLYVTGASLTNTGSVLTDERRILRVERWHTCEYDDGRKKCGNDHQIIDPPEEREGRTEYIASVLEAAGNVHIGTGVVVNGKRAIGTATTANPVRGRLPGDADGFAQGGIVDPTALPGFHLPESGLFRTAPPGAGYLVERNPDLASYEGFLGSQYLLDALDWSADITTQRLGDGWYELELLRDALLAATGSRFLAPDFNDEVAQFRHLMDNAIEAWEALELSPGIALSAEQVNRLNSDIVWLEPRRIGKQDVLVPVVYLAATRPALTPDGTVIAAGGDMFVDAGTLANSGTFRAAELLQVKTAGDLLNNGGTFSADTLVASAGRNLVNTSGLFTGHDVYLSATKDIRHVTHSELLTAGAGNTTSYRVALGRTAGVQASGNLVQTAGDDILLAGASLSGENIVLDAAGDLQVGTVALGEGLHAANDNWSLDRASWDYLATTIEAEVDAHLSAGEEMTLQAVQLSANTGDLSLFAGKDLAVLAATAGRSEQTWRREDKDYAEDITTTSAYDETLRRSTLRAGGDVLVNAVRDEAGQLVALGDSKGDVILQAVDIRQGGDAMVYAGKDLLVTAGVEQHYYHSETTRKYDGWVEDAAKGAGALLSATGNAMMPGYGIDYSFGLKGGSAEGNTRQHLVDSRFHGKGNTLLVAGEGVTLEAGRISGRDLYVSAGTNEGSDAGVTLAGLQTNDSRYREETTLVFGQTQGYGSLSTHAENTRSSREDNTRWHGTRVDMDGRVEIRSANDMFVQGADIRAGGDILLDAAGKMAIVAGESSRSASSNLASDANLGEYHNESDLHRSGTAEVSQFRSGGNITFESGGDQTHEGTLAKAAGGIALTSERGAVHLLAARDTEQTRHTEESSDFSWVTQKDSGRYDETLRMVSLQPRGQLIVDAAKGIDIDIERIDGKTGPALVNTLAARDPELAWLKDMADRGDIDWNRVQEVHESWSDEHEGLGAGASAVLAVAITAMTGGAGGAVWGGVSTTTAAGANAVAAATAATSAVVGAATTQVTLGTINNGGNLGEAISGLDRRESVEGLAISAFTAGTGSYVDALYTDMNFGKLPGEQIHSDAVRQLTYGFDLGGARGMAGFTLHHATMAGVEAGVQSLVAGDSFEGALKESLEQRGNDVVAALAFHRIGTFGDETAIGGAQAGDVDQYRAFVEGGAGRVGLHALVGGAVSELTGGEFQAGAAAGAANQIMSGELHNMAAQGAAGDAAQYNALRGAGSEVVGVFAAGLAGGDVAEGQWIAKNADTYNRQLHKQELALIAEHHKAYAAQRGISDEQALKELIYTAYGMVDYSIASDQAQYDNALLHGYDMESAGKFLVGLSEQSGHIQHSDGIATPAFRATEDQFDNSAINRSHLFEMERGYGAELMGLGRQPILTALDLNTRAGNYSEALRIASSEASSQTGNTALIGVAGATLPLVISGGAALGAEVGFFARHPWLYVNANPGTAMMVTEETLMTAAGVPVALSPLGMNVSLDDLLETGATRYLDGTGALFRSTDEAGSWLAPRVDTGSATGIPQYRLDFVDEPVTPEALMSDIPVPDSVAKEMDWARTYGSVGRSLGTIPPYELDGIFLRAIHNPSSAVLVLGKYEKEILPGGIVRASQNSYNVRAELDGAMYFDMGAEWSEIAETYELLDSEIFHLINIPVIDRAVENGLTIKFTHDPRRYSGALSQEWEYLKARYGYRHLVPMENWIYASD